MVGTKQRRRAVAGGPGRGHLGSPSSDTPTRTRLRVASVKAEAGQPIRPEANVLARSIPNDQHPGSDQENPEAAPPQPGPFRTGGGIHDPSDAHPVPDSGDTYANQSDSDEHLSRDRSTPTWGLRGVAGNGLAGDRDHLAAPAAPGIGPGLGGKRESACWAGELHGPSSLCVLRREAGASGLTVPCPCDQVYEIATRTDTS
jgi:hypothetical protein